MPRMLSKPFTTLTPKAKRSLTSGILLLGAGSCHPGLAGTERGTFLTLQRPHGTDLGCWPPPTACRVLQQPPRALRQPGQPCPFYGLCSPTVAYRHYLFYLICKYTKDVVLFIWSIHPHCSSKVKLRFPLLETDVPLQQRATCLCLMPGRMFPHHSWRQRRTVSPEDLGAHTGGAGKGPGQLVVVSQVCTGTQCFPQGSSWGGHTGEGPGASRSELGGGRTFSVRMETTYCGLHLTAAKSPESLSKSHQVSKNLHGGIVPLKLSVEIQLGEYFFFQVKT